VGKVMRYWTVDTYREAQGGKAAGSGGKIIRLLTPGFITFPARGNNNRIGGRGDWVGRALITGQDGSRHR
jgi:hypothetical protein